MCRKVTTEDLDLFEIDQGADCIVLYMGGGMDCSKNGIYIYSICMYVLDQDKGFPSKLPLLTHFHCSKTRHCICPAARDTTPIAQRNWRNCLRLQLAG